MHCQADSDWQGDVQFDIHSPALTVRESFEFSAQLRLLASNKQQLQDFVDLVCAQCTW